MKENISQYRTRDGKALYYRKWQGAAGDVIIYLHGIESNSGWFSQFASRLAAMGSTVYGVDRRGSGLNQENRGDIEDHYIFLDDIEDAINFVRSENPSKKIYLMGICWGAFLAVNYALKRHNYPDGLILLSPAIYRKVDHSPLVKMAGWTCSVFYPKGRLNIPIKDSMFTDNERYLDFIRSDKTRLHSLTCRFFKEILRMENDLVSGNNNIFVPVLVLLAGHDDIVDNLRVKKWFNALPAEDKMIKTFADFYHVMPFKEDINPLLDVISGWMKEREPLLASQSIKN